MIHLDEQEEKLLRSVALQNANAILLARERAERDLLAAKEALERRTEELTYSLEMMRATLEATTDGIFVTDVYGNVKDFNRRYLEMWRIPDEVIETRDHRKLREVHAQQLRDSRGFQARIDEIYASSPRETYDLLELSDGRMFERFTHIQRMHDRVIGRVWSYRDITERRRAQEVHSRLAAVVESSDDAIISMTLDAIITTWNEGAQRMYGYSADEVIGRTVTILLPPDRVDEETIILERLRQGERVDHYETKRLRKDGTILDVSLTVSPIKDASGRIIGASKSGRDITHRKQAEEALRKAQEELSRHAEQLEAQVAQRTAHLNESIQSLEGVCYTIAHDLRAPLRAMQGFTKILLEDYAKGFDAEGQRLAKRIVNASTRMDVLIRDLLDYARLSHADIPCVNIDLQPLVRHVVDSLSHDIASKNATVEIQALPRVCGNSTIVEQIFTNLLSNSLKFVGPGVPPKIEISAEKGEGRPRVLIRDNGIGIPAEHHERVFGMFQRLHSDEKKYSGTGVGLAIVKKGMERIGGRVGLLANVSPGACFYLDFQPAHEQP